MLYKLNVPLLIKGDRVAKGTEVELSDEEAAHLDPADLTPSTDRPVIDVEVVEVVALEDMSHAQLKDRAKELELSAAGSKADLQERIALHLAGVSTEGDEPTEEETETEGDEPTEEITND